MHSAKGNYKNIYAVRFEPGEDVMKGLYEICEKYNIKNGVIISAVGSLDGATFMDPAPIPGKEDLYAYGDPIELPAPVELISLDGIICTGEAGDTQLHVHCALSDQNGNGYGGHFTEGNIVLNTAEIVIGEIDGILMSRKIDPLRGTPCFTPIQL